MGKIRSQTGFNLKHFSKHQTTDHWQKTSFIWNEFHSRKVFFHQ